MEEDAEAPIPTSFQRRGRGRGGRGSRPAEEDGMPAVKSLSTLSSYNKETAGIKHPLRPRL